MKRKTKKKYQGDHSGAGQGVRKVRRHNTVTLYESIITAKRMRPSLTAGRSPGYSASARAPWAGC